MKVTTKICKEEIVKKCRLMLEKIKHEFEPTLTDEEVEKTLDVNNWKRDYKEKCSYKEGYEILFDCRPFDSQLRAYVYTDETDSIIREIEVVGE